ncbi:MAG TPA: replicative DNA helicase [Elusimicrobiales bacterium]|nr:replicative DNA helicase [Elusimicrobiales bacterium]
MAALSDKLPPQSLEAEMAVLGAMLIEPQAIERSMDTLKEHQFYHNKHKVIFRAIKDLFEKNSAVDLVTITEELKKRKKLGEIGGETYLSELLEKVSSAAHVEHYAQIVHNKSILRQLINTSSKIIESCYNEENPPEELLDTAQEKILNVSQEQELKNFTHAKELSQIVLERIETANLRKEAVTGVPTGFTRFDTMTGGLQKSDFVILAARPSQGKTAMALNIAYNASTAEKKKFPVAIFSLEMSKESIFQRMVCSGARANLHKVRTGMFERSKWTDLTRELGKLAQAPIWIDDSPGLTITDIRMRARRLASELKQKDMELGLIIIDYIQLMQGPGKRHENRQQEVSEISRKIKELARTLNIPVLALSQLNRKTEERSREGNKPQLSDLRESGSLEQDADLVALIHREGYYNRDNPELETKANLIIAKQRNGPVGNIELYFDSRSTRFDNLEMQTVAKEAEETVIAF